jgi:hypothetical protein
MAQRAVTIAAFTIFGLELRDCSPLANDHAWRQAQEEAIAVVVLKDLTELPPDLHEPGFRPTTFCACIGESWSERDDPPVSVLSALRGHAHRQPSLSSDLRANPFLFALSLLSLHLGLVGAGLVGIALLVYQAGRTTPRRHGEGTRARM